MCHVVLTQLFLSLAPDVAKMLADRVKTLSHELFQELVTQFPDSSYRNLDKVGGYRTSHVQTLEPTLQLTCYESQ